MWFNQKKIPISEVSEFSILPYTQNQKLKSFILLQFLIVYETQNLKTKNATYMKKFMMRFEKKERKCPFSRLQFCLTLEIENLETSESFCLTRPATTFFVSQMKKTTLYKTTNTKLYPEKKQETNIRQQDLKIKPPFDYIHSIATL